MSSEFVDLTLARKEFRDNGTVMYVVMIRMTAVIIEEYF